MKLPVRLRRLRREARIRRVLAETSVENRHLIQPYFIVPDNHERAEVAPGLFQVGAESILPEVEGLLRGGVQSVMLFGVPGSKSLDPKDRRAQLGPLVAAIQAIRSRFPEAVTMADVCLCSYLPHGHCGHVDGHHIVNDATLPDLAGMAGILGEAGVDFVCPSDMMDGRIGFIRGHLDEAGLTDTAIVSYAVKMASAFYGPFRSAAESAPAFGDRASYQMSAANRREARREWQLDEAEGADVLLFKPALTNLDLIRDAREGSDLPLFAYQVSGEYAMIRAAADRGLIDFVRASEEILLSLRRAGADAIVTYDGRRRAGMG